ncbi:hypothetical protein BGW36DRAFT_411985 [Talaromyces proteolyticus]|uniref:Arrestin-like N-terminal domain-containing protein n=1 Tax=Talaromyces proteolyticus TaxID=1131652 RepID=A0AAD4KGZ8_9EURO|nr:uncharacterized protein BGW36DRAFT_411985 [Talaromyces proteolyticus]KAH8690157.1 hypothetical protein BGW36DRAFT_411985 [Talaromyces proteolyticus]
MPPILRTGGQKLDIEVAAPPGWIFAAGDPIIGHVLRHTFLLTLDATVTLTLKGRIKFDHKANEDEEHYYNEEQLLGTTTSQTLFHGPLHVPKDSSSTTMATWPFSIEIPTKVDRIRHNIAGYSGFLEPDHPGAVLPGTFHVRSGSWSECLIEYYLEAQLNYINGGHRANETAAVCILLSNPPTGRLAKYDLELRKSCQLARSYRLLPGRQDMDESFKQKIRRFYASETVPQFQYEIGVWWPCVMQLHNEMTLPLKISMRGLGEKTSITVQGVTQHVRLNWIKLNLISSTTAPRKKGAWNNVKFEHDYDLGLEKAFGDLESPITIPLTPHCDTKRLNIDAEDSNGGYQTVDIGDLFQLNIRPNGLYTGNKLLRLNAPIYPDLVSYSMRHEHRLKWKVSFTVAGITEQIKGGSKVTIYPSP